MHLRSEKYHAYVPKSIRVGNFYHYLEVIGEDAGKIVRALSLGKLKKTVIGNDILLHNHGDYFKEELGKGIEYGVFMSHSIVKEPMQIIYGNSMEEMLEQWSYYLRSVQILPVPESKHLHESIFEIMVSNQYIEECNTTGGLVAYYIDPRHAEASKEMQESILDGMVNAGLLGLDRLRKRLKQEAPKNDAIDMDNLRVYVQFTDKKVTYDVLAYEPDTDMALAYVCEDGIGGFEEHNLGELFNTENIGILEVEETKKIVTGEAA